MEIKNIKATKGTRYHITYHLVWCPKFRRPVLAGRVGERVHTLLGEIAEKWGFEIVAQEVMPDHVHLFVTAPPAFSPSTVARLFKGASSYTLKREFPTEIKRHIRKVGTLWSPSYYVGTAGHVSADVIKRSMLECQHL